MNAGNRRPRYASLALCASLAVFASLVVACGMNADQPTAMPVQTPWTIDGEPILGAYAVRNIEDLRVARDMGMNVVLGTHAMLDTSTEVGRFCAENDIKVMHHLTGHIYGRPRLSAMVDADATTIPLQRRAAGSAPDNGVIQIDDELILYSGRDDTLLTGCERGYSGTTPTAHNEGIILLWPEKCREDVEHVKGGPNLWGYYVLDDSPGDALSALRGMYRIVKEVDPDQPVIAGYGSAGSLCNFAPGVCDLMMIYWYPVGNQYDSAMTSHQVQWMLADARSKVPDIPFLGVYQSFDGKMDGTGVPTGQQLRHQLEDFVREGAGGLISFCMCGGGRMAGLANQEELQAVVRDAHREILETGALTVRPEPDWMREARVQPVGFGGTPREVPGVVPAWHVIGPFDAPDGLGGDIGPQAGYDPGAVYPGSFGPARWVRRASHGGVVGLCELYGGQFENVTAFGYCTVTSPVEQRVQMRVGTDNDAWITLNGEEVFRYEGHRGIVRDNDVVEVTLPAGESRIVIEDLNRTGMWGFFMRFTDLDGEPLDGLSFAPSL